MSLLRDPRNQQTDKKRATRWQRSAVSHVWVVCSVWALRKHRVAAGRLRVYLVDKSSSKNVKPTDRGGLKLEFDRRLGSRRRGGGGKGALALGGEKEAFVLGQDDLVPVSEERGLVEKTGSRRSSAGVSPVLEVGRGRRRRSMQGTERGWRRGHEVSNRIAGVVESSEWVQLLLKVVEVGRRARRRPGSGKEGSRVATDQTKVELVGDIGEAWGLVVQRAVKELGTSSVKIRVTRSGWSSACGEKRPGERGPHRGKLVPGSRGGNGIGGVVVVTVEA